MAIYKTYNSIKDAVALFNKRLYNAGCSFKVYTVESNCVYVQASFDFAYYVNVHIQFNNVVFTNLVENENWPDAWHDNQLFLFEEDEIGFVLDWHDVELASENKNLFAFVFNINGHAVNSKGIVVAQDLEIWWEHPYND